MRRFRSAMLERPRPLFGWLGRKMFDHIQLPEDMAERLRSLPPRGQVVYVMWTRSLLDYLFFNYLFLKIGAPLAAFANGIDLSFFRGPGAWIAGRWRRMRERPDDLDPPGQLAHTMRSGGHALLFMRAVGLTQERNTEAAFIERLVAAQREAGRPILLVPQVIMWPRKPPSARRSWFDILFGDQDASGALRKLGHFVRHFRSASVRVGEPIDLEKVVADHAGWSDERIARKVRRVLSVHLGNEAMAVRGPRVKTGRLIKREIVDRVGFSQEIEAAGAQVGVRPEVAVERAHANLDEIAAAPSFEVLSAFGYGLDFVFNRIYSGVEVDQAGMRRVREAARLSRTAPLILVPSHKSHLDYLVISWVFLRNEFVPPHIAAGANLAFFPLGALFRRSGAFFLRRSFAGDPIYKAVFRRYLWKLVREGYPVEFFMEGGRSRTGKLLPPKMGMLSMLLEGLRAGEFKDLQFVPISISYERVIETGSYHKELTGGEKQAESVGGVVRAGSVLTSRYGRVYVTFEEPIRLTEHLARVGVPDLARANDSVFRDVTRKFGYHLMRRILEATVITPTSLVATALLSHDRRGMSAGRMHEMAGFLLDFLGRRRARLSRSLAYMLDRNAGRIIAADARSRREGYKVRGEAIATLLDEASNLLLKAKLLERVDRGGEAIYTVPERARLELDYYRNLVLGIMAPDTIVATALRAADRPLSVEELGQDTRRLSYWFRLEFIYRTGTSFDENYRETLDRLVAEGLVHITPDNLVVAAMPATLDFLRGALLHLVEGYWVAADSLRSLGVQGMDVKSWIENTRGHAEREFLEGDLRRAEAGSTALLRNAIDLFRAEGLVEKRAGTGRRPQEVFALRSGVTLEDVALRRDEIAHFLATRRDDPLPRPQGALPSNDFTPYGTPSDP
jgi:glycerol-3-phosphate O-acyltransferase